MANNVKHINSIKYNKHLTLNDRINIKVLIETNRNQDGSLKRTLNSIADILEKDPTTISKEIKSHATLFSYPTINYVLTSKYCNRCAKKDICKFKESTIGLKGKCEYFERKYCPYTLKFPYVCNGCSKRGCCNYPKRYYEPELSQDLYEKKLKESRVGCILTNDEFDELDRIVSNGLKKGQSISHIAHSNELCVSERTVYNYMNKDYFNASKFDTRRMLRIAHKPRKKPQNSKIMRLAKQHHQYEDYEEFYAKNPDRVLSQWDTVEGRKGGKVILSIKIVSIQFQFYFLLPSKEAKSVVNKLNEIQTIIGLENYKSIFGFALTDNGSEFSDIDGMIADPLTGEIRTDLFFCHTMASYEKGSCERNHELFRYIIPKGKSFNSLDDEKMKIITSHINSLKRKSTDFSTPIDKFYALFGQEILDKLGISKIDPNEVTLNKTVIK